MDRILNCGLGEMISLQKLDVRQASPLIWAYVGDAIYELNIRVFLLHTKGELPIRQLHWETVEYVNAEAQAGILKKIEPYLTEEEEKIVRKGRNTKSHAPKNAKVGHYRLATGIESLLGYLYLMQELDRLEEILFLIRKVIGESQA
jgi:ribonuclease-3 family protein